MSEFLGADMSTKLKLMGVDVASVGDAHGATPDALDYVFTDAVSGMYKKLVVSGDGKSLLGAILVGDAADYGSLLQMTLNPIPLPEHPEDLILPARAGAAQRLGRRPASRDRIDLLVQQRDQGWVVRSDRRRLHKLRRR